MDRRELFKVVAAIIVFPKDVLKKSLKTYREHEKAVKEVEELFLPDVWVKAERLFLGNIEVEENAYNPYWTSVVSFKVSGFDGIALGVGDIITIPYGESVENYKITYIGDVEPTEVLNG